MTKRATSDPAHRTTVDAGSSGSIDSDERAAQAGSVVHELFNQAPVAIAILRGPDHVYELSNPVNSHALGRDPTGMTVRDAFPEAAAQGYVELLDRVYRTGEPFSAREARIELKTDAGSTREAFIDFVYHPLRGEGGRVEGVLILGFDVTDKVLERRKAEESARRLAMLAGVSRALAEAGLDLDAIFQAIVRPWSEGTEDGAALHILQPDGRLQPVALDHKHPEMRAGMEQLLRGVPLRIGEGIAGRVAATGISILLPKVDPEALRAATKPEYAAFLARFPVHGLVTVPLRVQGQILGVLSVSRYTRERPLTDEDRVLLEDIADRGAIAISNGRHHRALRLSEQRFRILAEAIPQLVWTTLPDGRADYFNQRWYDFTGLTGDESLGFGWKAALHPDDVEPVFERWTQALAAGEIYESEGRFRHAPASEYRWMIARALPIKDDFGRITKWFGTCTDIQVQKESEHAKIAAVKARDDFLSIAGHELRTPLAALQLQVESARRLAGAPDAPRQRVAERLERMERHVVRLASLIAELLNVSRISAGRLELRHERVELAGLVSEVAERLRPQLAAAKSELRVEAPGQLTGDWDRLRLDQVVTNLLENAIKYGAGRPIEVILSALGDSAVLVVRDQGIGISIEDQKRVFERFERAVSDRHYGGLGLGLWIARQVVEAHGGTIGLESSPGNGTTFVIELPCRKPV